MFKRSFKELSEHRPRNPEQIEHDGWRRYNITVLVLFLMVFAIAFSIVAHHTVLFWDSDEPVTARTSHRWGIATGAVSTTGVVIVATAMFYTFKGAKTPRRRDSADT